MKHIPNEIFEAARTGDTKAFEALYKFYLPKLKWFLKDEDLAQNAQIVTELVSYQNVWISPLVIIVIKKKNL